MKDVIKQNRLMRGMTQRKYADIMGVTESCVSAWEAGRRTVGRYTKIMMTIDTETLKFAAKEAIERFGEDD